MAGLGLVGGSLARALSAAGHEVTGVDRLPVRRAALRAGAIARAAARLRDVGAVDVVVLAAPPEANLALLREAGGVEARAVTDVTSVKRGIVRAARAARIRHFVGGHPMAGTEGRGFRASRADLFRGRPWILAAPRPWRGPAGLVARMARAAGARPLAMTAAAHDRAVAFLSHAPQLVAWALVEAARRDPVAAAHPDAAGPAFASFARLARSPRALWDEIVRANADEVARARSAIVRALATAPPRRG